MFRAEVDINQKDYLACNTYYLKKFLGVKEFILVAALVVGGAVLYFLFEQMFILILCGVTILIMAAAMAIYFAVSAKGFTEEFTKRNTHKWKIEFTEEEIAVETQEENGEKSYIEKRTYAQIDKVAIRKDRVYIFAGAAAMYYVKYDSMTEGSFIDFIEFVKKKFPEEKFKMKTKRKQFPYGR